MQSSKNIFLGEGVAASPPILYSEVISHKREFGVSTNANEEFDYDFFPCFLWRKYTLRHNKIYHITSF